MKNLRSSFVSIYICVICQPESKATLRQTRAVSPWKSVFEQQERFFNRRDRVMVQLFGKQGGEVTIVTGGMGANLKRWTRCDSNSDRARSRKWKHASVV